MLLFIVIVLLLVAAVCFAAPIKNYLHKEESQIGAKLKADVEKVVPKVPGV